MPDDQLAPQAALDDSEPAETAPESPELESLRTALAERDLALAAQAEANRAMLDRVRTALLESEPAVLPELVTGDTLEEVEAGFAAAVAMVHRVRESVRAEQSKPVPAGAPGRTPPQPGSPFDKIRSGLGNLTH